MLLMRRNWRPLHLVRNRLGAEVKGEPEEDLEYFECSNVPVSTINHAFSSSEAGMEVYVHLSNVPKPRNA